MSDFSPPRTGSARPSGSPSTTEIARDEVVGVGRSVKQAGSEVADTATGQVKEVAEEAGRQARDLLNETRGQVREQARAGQQKAAEGLSTIAEDLRKMADEGGESGIAGELARQVSERVHGVASWLQQQEPDELLDEVRNWARRRPGAFLLGAAVAGVVAGRVTGGVIAAQRPSSAEPSTADSLRTPTPPSGASGPNQSWPGQLPPPGAMPPPPSGAMSPAGGVPPTLLPPPPGGIPQAPAVAQPAPEPGGPRVDYHPGGRMAP